VAPLETIAIGKPIATARKALKKMRENLNMNTQKKLFYRAAGVDNETIRRLIEDQANFYIGWHYDYLVRRELDKTEQKSLSQEQKDCLRDIAIRSYEVSNENFLHDIKDAGS